MDKRTVDWDLLVEEVFKKEIEQFLASSVPIHVEEKSSGSPNNVFTGHKNTQPHSVEDERRPSNHMQFRSR